MTREPTASDPPQPPAAVPPPLTPPPSTPPPLPGPAGGATASPAPADAHAMPDAPATQDRQAAPDGHAIPNPQAAPDAQSAPAWPYGYPAYDPAAYAAAYALAYAPFFQDRRLHPATIAVTVVRFLRRLVWIVAFAVVLRVQGGGANSIEVFATLFGVFGIAAAVLQYVSVRYAIRDGMLHLSTGLLVRQHRTIPLERIQNINVKQELIHRLLGVADVRIETASGGGAEAELSVVSLAEAEALRVALVENRVAAPAAAAEPDAVVYRARPIDLIVAGATRNRLGGVIAAVAGLLVYAQELLSPDGRNARVIEQQARHLSMPGWQAITLIALALIAAGWAMSIAGTLVGKWGFTLTRSQDQLRRTFGLLTKHASVFPVARVQTLRVIAPIVQRRLGFCRIDAQTAGSFSVERQEAEQGGSSELCPIVRRRDAAGMCRLVLPDFSLDAIEWQAVHPLARRRIAVRGCVAGVLIVSLLTAYTQEWWTLAALAPIPVLAWTWAWLVFRARAFASDGRYVSVRGGVFTRATVVVPIAKVQASFVEQSLMQRRLGLATLTLMTAGAGFGNRATIRDLGVGVAVGLQDAIRRVPTEVLAGVSTEPADNLSLQVR